MLVALPQSVATSLWRQCNQSCTDSGLHTHFSGLLFFTCADVHLKGHGQLPLCKKQFIILYLRTGLLAPVIVRGPAKLWRVPPPSRAHPRPLSEQAHGAASGSLQTRQGTLRAHAQICDWWNNRSLKTLSPFSWKKKKNLMDLIFLIKHSGRTCTLQFPSQNYGSD